MSRPRWTQFSLRFLFFATLLAASVAWWFRPGVVKPEFTLVGISRKDSGRYASILIQVRLKNCGPDSITFYGSDIFLSEDRTAIVGEGLKAFNAEKVAISYDPARPAQLQLNPGESCVISAPTGFHNKKVHTMQLGVDIANRRGGNRKTYWSQVFALPEHLFDPQ